MENDGLLSQGRISVDDPRLTSAHADTPYAAGSKAVATNVDRERTGVFTSLVKEDADIAGLVAYSIYKQNKLDWLQAFEAAKGRVPDEAELSSYIIGESTPRRLATYRHLAEATLAGHGPDVEGGTPSRTGTPRGKSGRTETGLLTSNLIVTYAIIAVLFVIAFWLAAHYTLSNR